MQQNSKIMNTLELTSEQHGLELGGSTYKWIFSINTYMDYK